jgi:hypothetical protein
VTTQAEAQAIATKMGIMACVATGDWNEAAEELHSLNADHLDKFYGELIALTAMTQAELREGNHR